MTTIRVWDNQLGWVYEVQDATGNTVARSKHLDELQERYPNATPSGAVVCEDNMYPES
jgi:hypothetical protein